MGFSSFANPASKKASFSTKETKFHPIETEFVEITKKMGSRKRTGGRIALRDLEPELSGPDLILRLLIHEIKEPRRTELVSIVNLKCINSFLRFAPHFEIPLQNFSLTSKNRDEESRGALGFLTTERDRAGKRRELLGGFACCWLLACLALGSDVCLVCDLGWMSRGKIITLEFLTVEYFEIWGRN